MPLEELGALALGAARSRGAPRSCVREGDLRQAKLQLVMANHMDPGNEALEAALQGPRSEARLARNDARPV